MTIKVGITMKQMLNDMEFELENIYNLFVTLDNALIYCNDSGIETFHLQTLSTYAVKRLDKFTDKF